MDFYYSEEGKIICNHTKKECPIEDTVTGSTCRICTSNPNSDTSSIKLTFVDEVIWDSNWGVKDKNHLKGVILSMILSKIESIKGKRDLIVDTIDTVALKELYNDILKINL